MESVPLHLRPSYRRAMVIFAQSCLIEAMNTRKVRNVEQAVGMARFGPCPCFARTFGAKHGAQCQHGGAAASHKKKCDYCANECADDCKDKQCAEECQDESNDTKCDDIDVESESYTDESDYGYDD